MFQLALAPAVMQLVFLLLVLLLAGLVALRVRRKRSPSAVSTSTASPLGVTAPTGSGRLAYEITLGVAGLLVGGLLILAGLWWIVIGLTGFSGLLFYSPGGATQANVLVAPLIGVVLGASGWLVCVLARARLLRL